MTEEKEGKELARPEVIENLRFVGNAVLVLMVIITGNMMSSLFLKMAARERLINALYL